MRSDNKSHNNDSILNWNILSKYRTLLFGCAIIGILFCHLDLAQSHKGLEVSKLANILHLCTVFVDVFMFLSGLGLYYSKRNNPNKKYYEFMKRRIIKIMPIYLIISIITYTIWNIFIVKGSVLNIIKDVFFVSWFVNGSTKYWFVLAILIFYLLFPLLYKYIYLYVGKNIVLKTIFLLIGYIIVTGIFRCFFEDYNKFMIAIERFPIFVLGVCCGGLSYENKKIPKWFVFIVSVLAITTTLLLYGEGKLTTLIYEGHYMYYFSRLVLALWLCFVIALVFEKIKNIVPGMTNKLVRVFEYIGRFTLEIYLFHQSYLILFDYPVGVLYLVVAVILPVLTGMFIYQIKSRVLLVGKKR